MAFSFHVSVTADLVEVVDAPSQRTRVPTFIGVHSVFAERAAIYSTLTEMIDDGFTTTDPEYKMASAMIDNPSNEDGPIARWFVGRRATPTAAVWNVEVLATDDGVINIIDSHTGADVVISTFVVGNVWTIDVDATGDGIQNILDGATEIATFTSSGSTAGQIRDGLIASLIAGYTATIVDANTFSIKEDTGAEMTITITGAAAANLTETETIAAGATTEGQIRDGLAAALIAQYTDAVVDADEFSITQTELGVPMVLSVTGSADEDIEVSVTTAGVGIADDLDAILAETINDLPVGSQTWGLFIEPGSLGTGGVISAQNWVHSKSLATDGDGYGVFVESTDVDLFDSGVTDDPGSLLVDLAKTRLDLAFRAVSTDYIQCRAGGHAIPSEPGTVVWNMKPLIGSSLATPVTYTQNGTFATKRTSYGEPLKETGLKHYIGGRDATGRQMYHYAAIDAWRDDMRRIIAFQLYSSDIIDMTDDGLEIGFGGPLRAEMERMVAVGRLLSVGTIAFTPVADIPDAEVLEGDYQTSAEITISATLRVGAERVAVEGTFSIPT
jgi:hypothetical protein